MPIGECDSHIEERDEGFYLCSLPNEMKNPRKIRDNTARILTVGNVDKSGVKQSVKGLEKCLTAKMDLWKTFEEPKTGARRSVKVSSILKGKLKWSHERDYNYGANADGIGSWVVKSPRTNSI